MALVVLAIVIIGSGYDKVFSQDLSESSTLKSEQARFSGSDACASCHAAEHKAWIGSQHAHAMQAATEQSVLGRFDGATFNKDGVVTTFFKKDDRFWVRTEGADGKLADFEVRYTFGIAPLQQYLIDVGGGRLQALGVAWDARSEADGGQRWYDLYPDRKLAPGNPLHWTGIDQNWNYQCAWCHSTNLKKNYDLKKGEFHTTWSEINVGCEACHGPASRHIAWAAIADPAKRAQDETKGFSLSFDERRNVTWPMGENGQASRSIPRKTSKEVLMCAGCHARRGQFSDNADAAGRFFDAFRPALLHPGLYHADGQQRDEVYTYASFAQSKMYAAGVTCSDCHNPHSGKTRLSGNAVCTQCHAAARFDVASHHHHAPETNGSKCISCHAPTSVYMGIDARHDHSFRIPRPDRTALLSTPNACNQCHTDKSASWARDIVKSWNPTLNPGVQDFAEAFSRADLGAPGAQAALLEIAGRQSESSIARASALSRLSYIPSVQALDLAIKSLAIDDPPVQMAAISLIAAAAPETRQRVLVPMLTNGSRLVRMDAARALVGVLEKDNSSNARSAFDSALAEYVDAQKFNSERPEAHTNLGNLYRDQGKFEEARDEFQKAIEIDPTFFSASINLAELVRSNGDEGRAEQILRDALAVNQGTGAVQHALGLSLIRQKRVTEAMPWLEKAAKASPSEARYSYVWAVALHDAGAWREAIGVLKSALVHSPYDRELLMALASYEIEANDFASALERAQLLNELEPGRSEYVQLLDWLKQRTSVAP